MKNELIGGSIGTALSAVGTGLQTNDVLQTISLVITIIGGLITFIIVPLVNWYKNAKKDGKIDKDELKDGVDIIVEGSEKIKDEIDDKKEGK
jgi:phosphate/sulfate permease